MQNRKEILNNLKTTTNKLKNFDLNNIENIITYKSPNFPQLSIIIKSLINEELINLNILSNSALLQLNISMNMVLNELIVDKNSGLLNEKYLNNHLAEKLVKANSDYQGIYFGINNKKTFNLEQNIIPKNLIENFTMYRSFNNHPFTKTDGSTFLLNLKGTNYLALIPQYEALNPKEIDDILNKTNYSINPSNKIIYSSFLNNIPKSSKDEFISNVNSLETLCKEKYFQTLDEIEI